MMSLEPLSDSDIKKAQKKMLLIIRHLNTIGEIDIYDSDDVLE